MVSRKTLLYIAACLWLFVSLFLLYRFIGGVQRLDEFSIFNFSISLALSALFYAAMFRKISLKHINRIKNLADKKYPFYAFFNARSYLVMIVMISMGISLKVLKLFPDEYLIYFFPVMGIPLLLSSMRFFFHAKKFA